MARDRLTPGSLDRRIRRPGKYEGEVEATEELMDMIAAGHSHDEVSGEGQAWYGLIINVPYGSKLVSAVLSEDVQGFVSARYFFDSKKAERFFDKIAAEISESEEDEDETDYGDDEED